MSTRGSSAQRAHIGASAPKMGGSFLIPILFPFLHPALYCLLTFCKEKPMMAAYRKYPYIPPGSKVESPPPPPPPRISTPTPPPQPEKRFLDALILACSRHHRSRTHSKIFARPAHLSFYHRNRRRISFEGCQHARAVHNLSYFMRSIYAPPPTRDEFLNLVDTYREFYSTQAIPNEPALPPPFTWSDNRFPQDDTPLPIVPSLPDPSAAAPATATSISSMPSELDNQSQQPHEIGANPPEGDAHFIRPPRDDQERFAIEEFDRIVKSHEGSHHQAFAAYSQLPSPGVSYLSNHQIRLLFRRLTTIEKKDKYSALQYLSVVEDMKSAGLKLTGGEWNSAISFCGQCYSHVRDEHVENALRSWKEMEQNASSKAGVVTFNILFDMAAKSGKFVLAEMIVQEMAARQLEPNRYSRVSRIYFYGLKRDGDGVRQAYRELVEAGEIVDTVVLNCVIAALIASGELAAAEHVYGRMKQMLASKTGRHLTMDRHLLMESWRVSRELGRLFDYIARKSRSEDNTSFREILKDRISIVPNLHTYSIFLEHHVTQTGDLHRISALLGEMNAFGVPLHGRVFLKLFKGFATHGGEAYSDWTSWRLKKVYQSLLNVVDDDQKVEAVKIQRWMVIWAVRAFNHCAGRHWALHVWDELRTRWKPDDHDLELAYGRLSHILDASTEQDVYIKKT